MSTDRPRQVAALRLRSWLPHLIWLFLFLSACAAGDASRALLELNVSSASLRADGTSSVAIRYHVARQATVSITLHAADGTTYALRDNVSRGPGPYSFIFTGAVDGRVIPVGSYELVATGQEPTASDRVEERLSLTITGADTVPPAFIELNVNPLLFTPNQDGVDDFLAIGVRVTEPVTIEARLILDGRARWLARGIAAEPGLAHISWPPPLRHAPLLYQAVQDLPPGQAKVEVVIQDRAGNRTVERRDITIGEAGTPQVRVTNIQFLPASAQAGRTITVTATIENRGKVTLRAAPPGPATFNWGENAHALGYAADPGTVRWGVDFSLNQSGIEYPFRWSLGRDLAPGESLQVFGRITLNELFPNEPVQFWLGVIHEHNRMLADERGITRIPTRTGSNSSSQ